MKQAQAAALLLSYLCAAPIAIAQTKPTWKISAISIQQGKKQNIAGENILVVSLKDEHSSLRFHTATTTFIERVTQTKQIGDTLIVIGSSKGPDEAVVINLASRSSAGRAIVAPANT